jgi:hypothetical protein
VETSTLQSAHVVRRSGSSEDGHRSETRREYFLPGCSGTSCIWKQTLKPGAHIEGSRVETRRFQSYGSTAFNLYNPTGVQAGHHVGRAAALCFAPHVVAVQVDPFESKGLKPGFHFIGVKSSRVETRRFQATVKLDSTCTAPHHVHLRLRGELARVVLHACFGGVLRRNKRDGRRVEASGVDAHVERRARCFVVGRDLGGGW